MPAVIARGSARFSDDVRDMRLSARVKVPGARFSGYCGKTLGYGEAVAQRHEYDRYVTGTIGASLAAAARC